jgi:hypothetical protein
MYIVLDIEIENTYELYRKMRELQGIHFNQLLLASSIFFTPPWSPL